MLMVVVVVYLTKQVNIHTSNKELARVTVASDTHVYRDIAAVGLDVGLSPLQVQGPGIFCPTISAIRRSALSPSDQR